MHLIERVNNTIQRYRMIVRGDKILVGLSGGPDSVCLLTVLNTLKPDYDLTLSAVYIDHGLRPGETSNEIDFCSDLCGALNVAFTVRHVDVLSFAKAEKLSKQEAARELRYEAQAKVAVAGKATRIALGHHADDQAETVLMRLFRGSGPSGLSGIPPVRKQIIRPLIEIERRDIEHFLEQEGIGSILDASNLSDEYLRNRIRRIVIPTIRQIDRNIVKTISRTADIFRDEERYFEILVTKTLMKLISRKTDRMIDLFLSPLEAMDTVILRRVLRRAVDETKSLRGITFSHIEDMISLIKHGHAGDRIYLPDSIRVIKRYATVTMTSEEPARIAEVTIPSPGAVPIKNASLVLVLDRLDRKEIEDYGNGTTRVAVDAGRLSFPLLVRSREPGDAFYPFGFGKRKKLQDYFVDQKIPRDERDSVPLLVHGSDIVWVVGHRLDDRFKIDAATREVLVCEARPFRV